MKKNKTYDSRRMSCHTIIGLDELKKAAEEEEEEVEEASERCITRW